MNIEDIILNFSPDDNMECQVLTERIKRTNKLEVVGATNIQKNLCISSEYDGKIVTKIKEEAFKWNGWFQTLSLPETLNEIGAYAFSNSKIEKLTIPRNVKRIGHNAFSGCEKLREVTFLGESCEIGSSAFADCRKLHTVHLPKKLSVISEKMFRSCTSLCEIALPESVVKIAEDAFRECSSLEHINIPNRCFEIGCAAFMHSGLRKLVLPEGIKKIDWHFCIGCNKLEQVYLPDSIQTIEGYAFSSTSLKEITLPKNLKKLGLQAFSDNRNLKTVIGNPEKVCVGDDVFENTLFLCENQQEYVMLGNTLLKYNGNCSRIVIPEKVNIIASHAFCKCTGSAMNSWRSHDEPKGNSNLKEIVIGNQVTTIGREAFLNCENLCNVVLENPKLRIEDKAFAGTKALNCSQDPFILLQDMLVSYIGLDEKIALPDNVTRILPKAFSYESARQLKHVFLNRQIKKIERGSFRSCNLESIVIPPEVVEIDENAFDVWRHTHFPNSVREYKTAEIRNIGRIICCAGSKAKKFAKKYQVPVTIISSKEMNSLISEVRQNYEDSRLSKIIKMGIVIEKHPTLSQLEIEMDFKKILYNFERFVERNPNKEMIEYLYEYLMRGLINQRVADGRMENNWATVATTAAFLSRFGHLTDCWYHLPDRQVMEREIESEHPILDCYNYLKKYYADTTVKEHLSQDCVHSVTIVNKQVLKQAWQQPDNYLYCLYKECSKAKTEEERVVYNRLLGILAALEKL